MPKLPQSFESELLSSSRTAYRLHRRVQRGAHGEVWRAVRRDDTSGVPLILKRLHQGTIDGVHSPALLAGLRERHFGEALRGLPRIARFVECFEESGSFWLVFRDEGISLKDLFYSWTTKEPDGAAPGAEQVVAVQPSALWLRLRLDASGGRVLRHMLRHFFEGLQSLHDRNVTHRDLKPANTIVDLRGSSAAGAAATGAGAGGEGAAGVARERLPSLRLADFGSAVDAQTLQPGVGLYPGEGPSSAEETADYQPPEASIGGEPFDGHEPRSYDLWSAGIIIIELLLATPRVLELSPRAAATLELRYGGQPAHVMRRLRIANGLAEHCISPAQGGRVDARLDDKTSPLQLRRLAHSCGLPEFVSAIRKRDPLPELLGAQGHEVDGVGALDEGLLELAWRLLRWHPRERLSAADALRHPALSEQERPPKEGADAPPAHGYTGLLDVDELRRLTRRGSSPTTCGEPDKLQRPGRCSHNMIAPATSSASSDTSAGGVGRPGRLSAEHERGISSWLSSNWWTSLYERARAAHNLRRR